MVINYEIEKIRNVLNDFNISTGLTIDLLREDFSPVVQNRYKFEGYCSYIQSTAVGKAACGKSDEQLLLRCQKSKKAEMHICHAGLIDVVTPILYSDEIIGYIIFGQIKTELDFAVLSEYIRELGLDGETMKSCYEEIVFCEKKKIESISNIAQMLIKYILFEKMLKPSISDSLQNAINYIDSNLQGDLSLDSIAKAASLSKSALYKRFHAYLSKTVGEYITEKRIACSLTLLKNTDLSIEEISQRVGFSSASYYSRMFKRIKGLSPMQYKKRNLSAPIERSSLDSFSS